VKMLRLTRAAAKKQGEGMRGDWGRGLEGTDLDDCRTQLHCSGGTLQFVGEEAGHAAAAAADDDDGEGGLQGGKMACACGSKCGNSKVVALGEHARAQLKALGIGYVKDNGRFLDVELPFGAQNYG